MRSPNVLAVCLFGLVSAAPAPQEINTALAYALPDPTFTVNSAVTAQVVTYDRDAIFAAGIKQLTGLGAIIPATRVAALPLVTALPAIVKKAVTTCTSLPVGYGPTPTPDTPSAFLALPDFGKAALAAKTPSGYFQSFQNLNASNNAYGYLGYTTLTTYDVNKCAAKCTALTGCASFNVYWERSPSVEPGNDCPNPPSTTLIKCAFWGGPVTSGNAVNNGQWRKNFLVVIAGSNGYVSTAIPTIPGYTDPVALGNAAINAPFDKFGADTFLGSLVFTSGPFDATLCARACSQQGFCQFFNTYLLYINSTANPAQNQGQYCALYSETWTGKYATNTGTVNGGDRFMIQYSFAYSNS
ncbi:uncharacterized protein K489DRAFT_321376, partial [Dissoconium aciculare CBS 342.82]|uniref:Apple domain-containing protein n=1 Tax=Dissoconium aciculare CBS 342.82 TaxID=1314786 RepID=A0A6J3M1G1_9PEZI